MRKEIQYKLRHLGMVKLHLTIYVIKDLLRYKSASSSQNQTEMLDRLNTAILCRDEIIVDLRKNNAEKHFDEF